MLTNAIYGYIYMTHGQIHKHRTRPADQCSHFSGERTRYRCKSGLRDGGPIQYFQAPSLPLYSRSPEGRSQHTDSRTQDCFYRQVVSEADSGATRPCKSFRTEFKRNRNPGLRKFSLQRPEAWLKKPQNKSSWIFVLTDYLPRNYPWHTGF